MMSQLGSFKYTPLPPDHIRLLHISPLHSPIGDLACKLKVFALEERPRFEALSYAWGTQPASEHIVCNNAKLSISPHLLEGLWNISTVTFVQWLWIDAICINQSDEIEKAVQVMQMDQIYSAASRVVVWMGPSDITETGIDAICAALENMDEQEALISSSREEIEQFLSPLEAWHDELAKLFTSSWFERLWIVQEVLLAQTSVALYGMQMISLASVIQLGYMVISTGLQFRTLHSREPLAACSYFLGLKHHIQRESKAYHAVDLLSLIRSKQTREPLDRVYAILGLLDEHVRKQIYIDYSQTSKDEHWKVYAQLCRLVLQECGESYLPYLSVADRSTVLPSWALDLDVRGSSHRLASLLRGADINAMEDEARGNNGFAFSDGGLALCLQAYEVYVIEKVLHVHPLDAKHNTFDGWISDHLPFVSSCYDLVSEMARSAGKQPLASLARVLVGGIDSSVSTFQEYPSHEADEDLRSCIEIWKRSELEYDERLDELSRGSNQRYLLSSYLACADRSLSLTRSGRPVLTPGDVQEGDIVVVVKGFNLPYVLRPAPDEGDQDASTYCILGSCYVEDIMDGQVFDSREFKSTGWSEVTII
jgi:hypothetical protein